MKTLKHPWALVGTPGPCYSRAVLGAVLGAVLPWHVGSAAGEKALHQCWGCLWLHMGEGRMAGSSHALTTSFPMSDIQISLGMHRGRQMCITFCLQSWAMMNLIWIRPCTNILLYNEGSVLDFFNFMNLEPVFFLGHRQSASAHTCPQRQIKCA